MTTREDDAERVKQFNVIEAEKIGYRAARAAAVDDNDSDARLRAAEQIADATRRQEALFSNGQAGWSAGEVEAARHVLGYLNRDGGWSSGSFTRNLLAAAEVADTSNFAKLARVFPELMEAAYVAKTRGVEELQRRVGVIK